MNTKKMKLIETGLCLFAEKGYHSTSIQEIATEAGISKGAFYLYFQSKEDFVTTAFQYFHQQISEQMEKIKQENKEPKKALANQINAITEYIYTYKGFITMHLRENFSISEKTDEMITQMKVENFQWMRENIKGIYGDIVEPVMLDCIIQLEGLINGYYKWIVIDDITIDRSKIGDYIVKRFDTLVQSMIEENEEALATIDQFPFEFKKEQDTTQILQQLRDKLKTLPLDQEKINQLHEVVDEIEMELVKDEPKKLLIQGLLVHLQRYPVLHDECEKMANLFDMELLSSN